jgi:cyanuric acid amidohydrolase
MQQSEIHTVPMARPDDVAEVAGLFDKGTLDPAHIVGIIAQTEGDGYARGYSALSLQILLAERLGMSRAEIAEQVPMLMIGGTAGLMSPHYTLFVNKPADAPAKPTGKRMSIAVTSTRVLKPEEYGTLGHIELVAEAVQRAMATAGITNADDVTTVQLKSPMLTGERIADAERRGKRLADPSPLVVAGMSRGASALGAAVALGEVKLSDLDEQTVGRRTELFTNVGFASSGTEQVAVRVVVIGNVEGAPGTFLSGRGVMAHQLDLVGAREAFVKAGLRLKDGTVASADRSKLAAAFVNAGADYAPSCLGRRHTMKSDFLSGYSGHIAKAVAHATVASVAGDPLIMANAGAEHQGKPGANLVFVAARH